MRQGEAPSTSMINAHAYLEFFKGLMEQGKAVLYLDMTKQISASFQQAQEAAAQIRESYPGQRLYLMDTLCVSGGLGLLLHYVRKLRDEGKSFDETVAWAEENKARFIHWFTVDDLVYLKRGGRVSAATALLGGMLNIKPVMHVDDEGHLIKVTTARGRKNAINALFEEVKKTAIDAAGQTMFISHGDCIEDAEYLAEKVKSELSVKDVIISYIGPVIGAHSGPGTLALFFIGTNR